MKPRPATLADVDMVARIHVQAWQETYPGLLPEAEIAKRTFEGRQFIWARALARVATQVWVIDDLGFAHFGPQREDFWRDQGYADELYAIYLLRDGYGRGLGRKLFEAVCSPTFRPFTACVVEGNTRACMFYEKSGGQILTTRNDIIGTSPIVEHVYGWTARPFRD